MSFQNICKEIGASDIEEIDLLIKNFGPSSRRQATSLKSAYIFNMSEARKQIWSRLDERFGTPEPVYQAATSKPTAFPKLSAKNPAQLYDLSHIPSEIEGLQLNPKFASILAYFDSIVGINPIVSKLPHSPPVLA